MQQAELLEMRKEVLEKKIEAELTKAKQFLKQGNKAGECINHTAFLTRMVLFFRHLDITGKIFFDPSHRPCLTEPSPFALQVRQLVCERKPY